MDINCYAFEQDFVLDHFQEGEFDFMDSASEVVETEFFQFIGAMMNVNYNYRSATIIITGFS